MSPYERALKRMEALAAAYAQGDTPWGPDRDLVSRETAADAVMDIFATLDALRPAFRQTSWPDAERRGVELSPWPASWRRSASGSGSRRSPSHTHWAIEARAAPLSAESLIE